MKLPGAVKEIAEVIGRENALRLIGRLPRRRFADPRSPNSSQIQASLYVPKILPADHWLVRVLGWHAAKRLSDIYGGELIKPPVCEEIYREWRNREIARLQKTGMPVREISEIVKLTDRMILTILKDTKEEEI